MSLIDYWTKCNCLLPQRQLHSMKSLSYVNSTCPPPDEPERLSGETRTSCYPWDVLVVGNLTPLFYFGGTNNDYEHSSIKQSQCKHKESKQLQTIKKSDTYSKYYKIGNIYSDYDINCYIIFSMRFFIFH